jgi:DNA-binding transcriptional MerR regulator|tara:strand:+ start:3199 stop:3555 length:357 start_codon:yes stop_codon:yes gene_type:complete
MKVWQYAKENGMTTKEVKELFDLPSHMSIIPESCDELPEVKEDKNEVVVEIASKQAAPVKLEKSLPVAEVVEIVKEAVEDVKDVLEEADVDLELIERSIRGAGTKSPYWSLRHLIGRD